MNWALTRPRAPSARHDPLHRRDDQALVARPDAWAGTRRPSRRCGRRPARRARAARDQDPLAVGDGVDVDLDALEVAVDPDRPVGVDDGRGGELADEVLGRVAEVDREAADDEARADDDRVADPLGEGQRLLEAVGHAALRLGDAEPVEERGEAGPLLGLVDGLEVAAEQRDAGARAAPRGSAASGRRTRPPREREVAAPGSRPR